MVWPIWTAFLILLLIIAWLGRGVLKQNREQYELIGRIKTMMRGYFRQIALGSIVLAAVLYAGYRFGGQAALAGKMAGAFLLGAVVIAIANAIGALLVLAAITSSLSAWKDKKGFAQQAWNATGAKGLLTVGLAIAATYALMSAIDGVVLAGFALGAVVAGVVLMLKAHLIAIEDESSSLAQNVLAIVSASAMLAALSIMTMVAGGERAVFILLAGTLASMLGVLLTRRFSLGALRGGHIFVLVATALGLFVIVQRLGLGEPLFYAGLLGLVGSGLVVGFGSYYSRSIFRPAVLAQKAVKQGIVPLSLRVVQGALESVLLPVLVLAAVLFGGYWLGVQAGADKGMLGLVVAASGLLSSAAYVLVVHCFARLTSATRSLARIENVAAKQLESAPPVAFGLPRFLMGASVVSLVVVLNAYLEQLRVMMGDVAMIVNVAKVNVIAGSLAGVFVLSVAVLMVAGEYAYRYGLIAQEAAKQQKKKEPDYKRVLRLLHVPARTVIATVLALSTLAAVVLGSEAMGVIVVVSVLGCVVSWMGSTAGALLESVETSKSVGHMVSAFSTTATSMCLLIGAVALVLAPLL